MFKFAQSYIEQQNKFINSNLQLLGKKIKETHDSPTKNNSIGRETNPYGLTSGALTKQTSATGFNNAVADASLPRTSTGGYQKLITDVGKAGIHMAYAAAPVPMFNAWNSRLAQGALSLAANDGDPVSTALSMARFARFGKALKVSKKEPLIRDLKKMNYKTSTGIDKSEYDALLTSKNYDAYFPKSKKTFNFKNKSSDTPLEDQFKTRVNSDESPKYTSEGFKIPDYLKESKLEEGTNLYKELEFKKYLMSRNLSNSFRLFDNKENN